MTVKELIEELSKFPPDMPVYTSDYEYGDDECTTVVKKEITAWHHNGVRYNKTVVLVD